MEVTRSLGSGPMLARRRPELSRRVRVGVAGLSIAGLACGAPNDETPPEEPLPVTLAPVDGWVRVTGPAADLFGPARPPGLTCDETLGYGLEDLGPDVVLEVNTDLCDWFTGTQPTLVALEPRDVVSVRVWHYDLVAPSSAEGYVALAIGGEIEWEAKVAIPGPPGLLEGEIEVDRDLPAGTELAFHVRNHGVNTWDLLEITAVAYGSEDG